MRSAVRWVLLLGVLGYSYFAFTKVEKRDTKTLAQRLARQTIVLDELQKSITNANIERSQKTQDQRKMFLILLPDSEAKIDRILGLVEEEAEESVEEEGNDA